VEQVFSGGTTIGECSIIGIGVGIGFLVVSAIIFYSVRSFVRRREREKGE
jgi:hypothetical protein